jgi:hypothetical protein
MIATIESPIPGVTGTVPVPFVNVAERNTLAYKKGKPVRKTG